MKKIYIILLAVAAAAIACTKEAAISENGNEAGKTVFSGTCISTKISLGEKTGDVYPALWEAGDKIDVYNAETGTLIGTAELESASAGQQSGSFILNQTIADGTKVKIVYPSGDGYKVPAEQTKLSAGDKALLTKAESSEITVASGAASFSLSHQNAVIKVDVTSSEFAGRLLKSVTLYAKGAAVSDDGEYARVTFSNPSAISDNNVISAVFMAKPIADATDFYVAVKMVNPSDELDMVTIPKKFPSKPLNAGKVTRIDCTTIATSDNAVAWYNPACKRYIPEGGWCYGSSTTLIVAPTVNSSAELDVRACGEFIDVIRYASEPKQIQLRCGDIVDTGTAGVWTIDGTTPKKNAYAALNSYTPTIVLAKAIANSKKTVAGFLNLCDAANNVIWAYLFWGAAPGETTYDSGKVMNMNLGGSAADGKSSEQRGAYYQWGRPFPFGYGDALQTVVSGLSITSYSESAAHANSMGISGGSGENTDWWQDGTHKYDLWGNPETSSTSTGGKKSIFDPCPQGWKVAPASVLKEVHEGAQYNSTKTWYEYKGDVYCATSFRSGNTASRGSSSKGLYWADNANSDVQALHYEIINDASADPSFGGTWRSNACAVRCVKDSDNR